MNFIVFIDTEGRKVIANIENIQAMSVQTEDDGPITTIEMQQPGLKYQIHGDLSKIFISLIRNNGNVCANI